MVKQDRIGFWDGNALRWVSWEWASESYKSNWAKFKCVKFRFGPRFVCFQRLMSFIKKTNEELTASK